MLFDLMSVFVSDIIVIVVFHFCKSLICENPLKSFDIRSQNQTNSVLIWWPNRYIRHKTKNSTNQINQKCQESIWFTFNHDVHFLSFSFATVTLPHALNYWQCQKLLHARYNQNNVQDPNFHSDFFHFFFFNLNIKQMKWIQFNRLANRLDQIRLDPISFIHTTCIIHKKKHKAETNEKHIRHCWI